MREEFIQTRNYIKLVESFANLKNLPETAPRMGLAFGDYGLGKTVGLERVAAQENAILLRAVQTWSKSSLLIKLCTELGLDTKGHSSMMYERVRESFILESRIVIIDEVDALLKAEKLSVLELLRDLHDETQIIIFFVGMEEANAKFKKYRHYYSRIVELVKFEGIILKDIESFCALSDVKIETDLIHFFVKRYPNLRQIKVLLLRLENWCEMNGLKSVDLNCFKKSGVEHGHNTQN
ncbi:MAG: ATP-binding protein [Campylobacterales bacterium]|nr:ATP-binding protein [Campylobacterales bacterium]